VIGFAIEVVMVIMTSDGAPMGFTCRLSMEGIIFCARLLSTRIVASSTKITHKKMYKKYVLTLHAKRCTKNTRYCLFAPSGNSNDDNDNKTYHLK